MMAALPYIAFVVLFSLVCAAGDDKRIARLSRIRHVLAWCVRASTVAAAAFIVACFLPSWWTLLPLLVLGAALFSLVFRYRLNGLRKLDWRYVSRSNFYDTVFLYLAGTRCGVFSRADCAIAHRDLYRLGRDYTKRVHRAGLYGYIAETIGFILSLVVLGAMNKNLNP